MQRHFEHLVKEIPNNPITRYLVRRINRRMLRSEIKYRLKIRGRQPKVGGYGWFGHVDIKNAKTFSLYLEKTPAAMTEENRKRKVDQLEVEIEKLRVANALLRKGENPNSPVFAMVSNYSLDA